MLDFLLKKTYKIIKESPYHKKENNSEFKCFNPNAQLLGKVTFKACQKKSRNLLGKKKLPVA